MVRIVEFRNSYQQQVVDHILEIENEEFALNLDLADQPDLLSIEKSYQKEGGNFWIAVDGTDSVVGTIGLYNLGDNLADLRKMFVKPNYRGKELGISQGLLDTLMTWAMKNNFKKIYLESTTVFAAAIKFYMRNGFEQLEQKELPKNFPIIKCAELFFAREL